MEIGGYVHEGRVLLVDDIELTQRNTMPPTTPAPTFAPTEERNTGHTVEPMTTEGRNAGHTVEPMIRTEALTKTTILSCPLAGDDSLVVGAGSVVLRVASMALCTLSKSVTDYGSDDITLIPIARSYNNNPWEQSTGEYAASILNGVDIECYAVGCQLNLPALDTGAKYILSSSLHSLSESDEYARFLETATFGVTQDQLDTFVESSNSVQSDIANWISEQMNPSTTPMTSHREYWRKGVMTRVRRRKDLNDNV